MMSDEGGDGDTGQDCACSQSETSDSTNYSGEFRLGAILDALSHPTRRKVLVHLESCEGAVSLGELASEIGSPYTITDPLRRSAERDHHVEMQLYHVHLPKLDQEGLVTFDTADRTVAISEDGEEALRRLF